MEVRSKESFSNAEMNTVFNMIFGAYAELSPEIKELMSQQGDYIHSATVAVVKDTLPHGSMLESMQKFDINIDSMVGEIVSDLASAMMDNSLPIFDVLAAMGPVDAAEEARRICSGLFVVSDKH